MLGSSRMWSTAHGGAVSPPSPQQKRHTHTSTFHRTPAAARAMQIQLVFDLIVKQLAIEQLHDLRLTCLAWNKTFVDELKRRGHCSVRLGCRRSSGLVPHEMWKFGEFMRHRLNSPHMDNPFTKFSLHVSATNPAYFQDLFKACGGHVRSLCLAPRDPGGWSSEEKLSLDTLRSGLFHLVPRLEVLEIRSCVLEGDRGAAATFCLDNQLPNLRRLAIEDLHGSGRQTVLNDLARAAVGLQCLVVRSTERSTVAVGVTLQNFLPNLRNLPTLALSMLNAEDMKTLIALGRRAAHQDPMRLHKFTYCASLEVVTTPSDSLQLLYAFLETQCPTLRELELELVGARRETEPVRSVRVPYMRSLHTFRLVKSGKEFVPVLYDNATFGINFPSLRSIVLEDKLQLEGSAPADLWYKELEETAHDGVTEVSFRGHHLQLLNLPDCHRPRFPGLLRLELHLHSEVLPGEMRTLWTAWPTLEVLQIKYTRGDPTATGFDFSPSLNDELDELLTGVPRALFENLRCDLPPTVGNIRQLLGNYKSGPGISDLKRLRAFSLILCCYGCGPRPTDLSGYLGFAVTPTLQRISVETERGSPEWTFISPDCIAFVKEVLGPRAVTEL